MALLPGPDCSLSVAVPHCHWLDGHPGPEAACPEPREAGGVSGGALREHKHLGPCLRGERPISDLMRGLLATVLALPIGKIKCRLSSKKTCACIFYADLFTKIVCPMA